MPILQMETTAVRTTGQQLNQLSQTLEQQISQLSQATNRLDSTWDGMSAHHFMGEMRPLLHRLQQVSQSGVELSQRVEREVQEWEETASRLGESTAVGIGAIGGAVAGSVGGAIGGTSSAINANTASHHVELGEPFTQHGMTDANIPLYKLDMDNLDSFDPEEAANELAKQLGDTGRPVIFLAHGINTADDKAISGFEHTQVYLDKEYGELPPDKRPIIVGIKWDSEHADFADFSRGSTTGNMIAPGSGGLTGIAAVGKDYWKGNRNAVHTGREFGQFLEHFNNISPETSVNVMTHSLGTKMVMEGIAQNNVKIDNFLAVQGAVDLDEISDNGRYAGVLNPNEVGRFGATYTDEDKALAFHLGFRLDEALGQSADELEGNVKTYRLDDISHITGVNHYNYSDEIVHDQVVHDFFSFGESNQDPFQQQITRVPDAMNFTDQTPSNYA